MKHILFMLPVLCASIAMTSSVDASTPSQPKSSVTCTFMSSVDPSVNPGGAEKPLKIKLKPVADLPSAVSASLFLPGQFAAEAKILAFPLRDENSEYTDDWHILVSLMDGAKKGPRGIEPTAFARMTETFGTNSAIISSTIFVPANSPEGKPYFLRQGRSLKCWKESNN